MVRKRGHDLLRARRGMALTRLPKGEQRSKELSRLQRQALMTVEQLMRLTL